MTESAFRSQEPEQYMRINITRNTRGYQGETTVSIRGDAWEFADMESLLQESDRMLREEIARREAVDRFERK